MRGLIEALLALLGAGERAVLVRVIRASGSAPRGPGAAMVVGAGGRAHGTVGGGTVEHESIRIAGELLFAGGGAAVRDFALRNSEAADLGMVCGGDVRMLFQPVAPEGAPLFREALDRIAERRAAYLLTDVGSGRMWLADEDPGREDCFAQPLMMAGRTFVFGAGHVARALVPLLVQSDFRAIVLDDRPDFADPALFPGAEAVRAADFARLDGLEIGRDDAAVIMTRGHGHDLTVLAQVLRTPARYVGMMGSRTKREHVYGALRAQGFLGADIARVHSPIGIPIGAETPAEIAVSIAAELIRSRAGLA